jgi:hypothetical protein
MALLNVKPRAKVKLLNNAKLTVTVRGNVYYGGVGYVGSTSKLRNGLVAFYKFDSIEDSSDSKKHLQQFGRAGEVTFDNGKIGKAATFTNTGDFYCLAANYENPIPFLYKDSCTISFWAKPASLPAADSLDGAAFSWTNGGITFLLTDKSFTLTNDKYTIVCTNRFATSQTIRDNKDIKINNWFHVVIRCFDGQVVVNINNKIAGTSGSASSPITNILNSVQSNLHIGGSIIPNPNPSLNNITFPRFNGQIDSFGIWSRVLTTAEISSLYNYGAGRDPV